MRRNVGSILLLHLLLHFRPACSFSHPRIEGTKQGNSRKFAEPTQLRSSTSQYDVKAKRKARSRSTKEVSEERREKTPRSRNIRMKFVGNKSVSTRPIPLPDDEEHSLIDFFAVGQHRNLLFFRNDVSVLQNPTEEQIFRWSEEGRLAGGEPAINLPGIVQEDSQLLQMKAYLQMPGLKVLSENIVGAKLVKTESGLPEYQFTVIDSKLKPEGPAALVWLFNKIIKYMDGTSSFTKVRASNAGGINCDKVIFTTDARLETRIVIPSAVVRVLPVNISKFEDQGSKSMQKLLEKELGPALECFSDAYLKWASL